MKKLHVASNLMAAIILSYMGAISLDWYFEVRMAILLASAFVSFSASLSIILNIELKTKK